MKSNLMENKFINLESEKIGDQYSLKLFLSKDQKGIIYRVTSVLYANDWSINSASLRTLQNDQIEDEFLIQHKSKLQLDETELQKLKDELEKLFKDEISITTYLIKKGKSISSKKNTEANIQFSTNLDSDSSTLRIRTKDRDGLLCDISRLLFLECIEILSVDAKTYGTDVDDKFEIKSETGHSIEEGMQERLIRNLRTTI